MMHIPNNIYIRCDKCGSVTLVEADSLDYETSVYDRPMGELSMIFVEKYVVMSAIRG